MRWHPNTIKLLCTDSEFLLAYIKLKKKKKQDLRISLEISIQSGCTLEFFKISKILIFMHYIFLMNMHKQSSLKYYSCFNQLVNPAEIPDPLTIHFP